MDEKKSATRRKRLFAWVSEDLDYRIKVKAAMERKSKEALVEELLEGAMRPARFRHEVST